MFQKPIEQTLASCLSFDFRLFIWCHLNIARIHTQLWRRRWWLKSWWFVYTEKQTTASAAGTGPCGVEKKSFLIISLYLLYLRVSYRRWRLPRTLQLTAAGKLAINTQHTWNMQKGRRRSPGLDKDGNFFYRLDVNHSGLFFLPTERTRISMAK